MRMTTTFNKLREKSACESGYKKLAKHLGGVTKYGADTEIDILTILESNGFDDAMWSLRATLQDCDNIKRLVACDFAESVLHIFESKRPGDDRVRKCIESARGFANGTVSAEEMRKARSAATDAYAAAAADADAYAADADAYAADAYAADAAAYAADAYAAYAADAAAYAAAAADADAYAARRKKREQMSDILRKHLS